MTAPADVTELLRRAAQGDRNAFDVAFGLLYAELQGLAHAQLRREAEGHTLDTSSLVHEAYLRLGSGPGGESRGRSHFLAIAATAMRRVLVDHARRTQAAKRGGAARVVGEAEFLALAGRTREPLVTDLDEALQRLAELDARQAKVVECRYFGGLTEEETALALDLSVRTVKRDWAKARSWLYLALAPRGQADRTSVSRE
jgi:RNA polymerase sigma-70 factor, ECF subfamily